MFLQNVNCLRYGTLRYVTWGWKTGMTSLCHKLLWHTTNVTWWWKTCISVQVCERASQSPVSGRALVLGGVSPGAFVRGVLVRWAASQLVTRSTRHSPKSYDELTGGWNTVLWRVDRLCCHCCDELTARCCRRRLKDYMSRHSYGARFSKNLRKNTTFSVSFVLSLC